MRLNRYVILLLSAVLPLFAAGSTFALDRTQIVLVVNRNVPEGEQLAQFYAKARNIPPNHIVSVSLPATEEISFQQYEREVARRSGHSFCAITWMNRPPAW